LGGDDIGNAVPNLSVPDVGAMSHRFEIRFEISNLLQANALLRLVRRFKRDRIRSLSVKQNVEIWYHVHGVQHAAVVPRDRQAYGKAACAVREKSVANSTFSREPGVPVFCSRTEIAMTHLASTT
jgi:hypothetical protein